MTSPEDVDKYLLKDGDVVISRAGSVGFSYLLNKPQRAVFASYLIRFRPLIESKYFAYFLKSPIYWKSISEKKLGIAVQNVNAVKLKEISIPIPPLNEQKRIVAKIEQLFSDLDAGVETLKAIKKQIRQYRQSVLKYAFEGKLTAEWRKKNKPEPASKLLEKIAKERQQQSGGKKQKTLPPLDTSDLPELPDEWQWTRIDRLLALGKVGIKTGPFGSLLKKHEHKTTGVPVLGIESIGKMEYLPGNKIFVTEEKAQQLSGYQVNVGDIIISRSGTVGEICVIPKQLGHAIISTNLMRVSLNKTVILPHIFGFMFQGCSAVLKQVSELCKGSTRDFLNQTILKTIIFPLPPFEEQKFIFSEIERHFSIADKAEEIVNTALRQSDRLRQSILKQAFEGKLVPQDPTDEPAEKLLERINKEEMR